MMKRVVSVTVVALVLLAATGAALAGMRGMGMGHGYGPGHGWMGGGPMGMGMGRGRMMGECPRMGAPGGPGAPAAAAPVGEEKAKELAQQYADQYLKGFTVEKVLPFEVPRGTAYSIELKGPGGEVRTFHVNPWGRVMPFPGPAPRAS
jgi:hypothetical protein